MRILLTGVDGFIGSALVDALDRRGHALPLCARYVARASCRWPVHRVDFAADAGVDDWIDRLAGADAVGNAVGIFREVGAQAFESIHVRAPIALFKPALSLHFGIVQPIARLPDWGKAAIALQFYRDSGMQAVHAPCQFGGMQSAAEHQRSVEFTRVSRLLDCAPTAACTIRP